MVYVGDATDVATFGLVGPLSVGPVLTIRGTSADASGVQRVEVHVDNSLEGNAALSSPGATSVTWSLAWNVPPGAAQHSIVAKAFDVPGNQGPSSPRTVTTLN